MAISSVQPVVPAGLEPFGRWFEKTFRAFAANWGVWVLQSLIYNAAAMVVVVVGAVAIVATFGMSTLTGLLNNRHPAQLPSIPTSLIASAILIGVLTLVMIWAVATFLQAGMNATAVKQLRGEPIAVADIFSAGYAFWPSLGATVLCGLLTFGALLLCIVPALFVWPFFFLLYPIIVDRRQGAIDSLAMGYALVKQNYFLFFLYGIVISLLGAAVSAITNMIPLLGPLLAVPLMLVIVPITILARAVPYVDICYGSQTQFGFTGPVPYLPPAYTPTTGSGAMPSAPPAPETDEPHNSATFTWKNPDAR
ncbi:MAG TPA: hypothetical protein VGL77_17405 [Armatimonadota bacterium]|jgi:uncharacterized membrane protein